MKVTTALAYRVQQELSRHPRITNRKELSQYLQISESALSRLLSNPNRKMSQNTFDKLASFLAVPFDKLEAVLADDAMTDDELRAEHAVMQERAAAQTRQILDLSRRLEDLEDIFNTRIEGNNEGRQADGPNEGTLSGTS